MPSVGHHVGGWVIFSPKKQLVHGTNWWVYCPFPKKQLVHGNWHTIGTNYFADVYNNNNNNDRSAIHCNSCR